MSSEANIIVAIDQHKMVVVECDGIELDGTLEVDYLPISVAQRYSVIVKAIHSDMNASNFWIRAEIVRTTNEDFVFKQDAAAVLRYVDNKGIILNNNLPSVQSYIDLGIILDPAHLSFHATNGDVNASLIVPINQLLAPTAADEMIQLDPFIAPYPPADEVMGFSDVNGSISYRDDPVNTLLGRILNDMLIDDLVPHPDALLGAWINIGFNNHYVEEGKVYDIVLTSNSDIFHPMHFHGHVFYVVYQGDVNSNTNGTPWGTPFDYTTWKAANPGNINLNAPIRDTAGLNPMSTLVLRFRADNPGAWLFHCHYLHHAHKGMMANIIYEPFSNWTAQYRRYKRRLINCNLDPNCNV